MKPEPTSHTTKPKPLPFPHIIRRWQENGTHPSEYLTEDKRWSLDVSDAKVFPSWEEAWELTGYLRDDIIPYRPPPPKRQA
jgi:hypothetical protein